MKDLKFRLKRHVLDSVFTTIDFFVPYKWSVGDPENVWLESSPTREFESDAKIPRQIFVLWTGKNELTVNRLRSLDSISTSQEGIAVHFVTESSVTEFEVEEHPFHSQWRDLSYVHRADYLRAYLMHFHGGGYVDLKPLLRSWSPAFEAFDKHPDVWVIGYPEVSSTSVAEVAGRTGRDLRLRYRRLVGNGAFIFRPMTPLTQEWLREVERRIDANSVTLRENPGNERGTNPGYPVAWTELLGSVLGPLILKYNSRVLKNDLVKPELKNYL